MPVTIASTGLFNGGVAAGLPGAAVTAFGITNPGSGTNASAGLARATPAGLAASVTTGSLAPLQPALGTAYFGAYPGGANTDPNASYNGGTWEGATMSNRVTGCYYRYWQLSDCPSHPNSDDVSLVAGGRTLVISLTSSFTVPPAGGGITYASVAAGTYDTDLNDLAANIKNLASPCFVNPFHEFELSANSGYGSATDFISAYQHIANVLRAGAPGMVAMAWDSSGTGGSLATYYPGDAYADWLGVDPYDPTLAKGSPTATYTPYITFLNTDPLAVAGGAGSGGGHGKPIGIFETGVEPTYDTGTGSGTEAYWLAAVPACLETLATTWGSQYQLWQWFNDTGTWNTKITPGGNAASALATIGATAFFSA